jgi:hypothetical protein
VRLALDPVRWCFCVCMHVPRRVCAWGRTRGARQNAVVALPCATPWRHGTRAWSPCTARAWRRDGKARSGKGEARQGGSSVHLCARDPGAPGSRRCWGCNDVDGGDGGSCTKGVARMLGTRGQGT